jgi:hypothetical protein
VSERERERDRETERERERERERQSENDSHKLGLTDWGPPSSNTSASRGQTQKSYIEYITCILYNTQNCRP